MPKNTGRGSRKKPVTETTWIKPDHPIGVFTQARTNGGKFHKENE